MSLRTAMILAAGKGSRLAPLTDRVAKPMVEIAGQPLIFHQLHWLAAAGITRVVINLHHLGEQIETAIGDGTQFDLTVVYSKEEVPLETGGGIRQAAALLGDAPFLLLNGDIFTDFDFRHLPQTLAPHLAAHILLTPTPASRADGDFGFIHHRVNRHNRDYVYCGISVMRHSFAKPPTELIHQKQPAFSLQDPLFRAAEDGRLAGQLIDATWSDIGTIQELNKVRASMPPR